MATPRDAAQVAAIYEPIVRDTAISFESRPPSDAEMARRIETVLARAPWLVATGERGDELLGYAYAGPHNEREAYRWSVNVSVYVGAAVRRGGVGRALYETLFRLLRLQGFYTAHAGVTLPNAGSVGLHESLGFVPVGVYRSVGYKLGAWHDVGWWQLPLRERAGEPRPPLTPREAEARSEWRAALSA